jgi:CHAD domain-containing protein
MARRIERADLEKLQRRAVAAARRNNKRGRASARRSRWLSTARSRAERRALTLVAAIDNAGGIYLPDRLHQVRIAVKKLRYAMEIARELSRSRATAPIRTLMGAQDLLGRMHDLEVLIMRIRALQGSDQAPNLKLSADLDRLVRRLETECRQLHVRYLELRKKLRDVCDHVTAAEGRRNSRPASD